MENRKQMGFFKKIGRGLKKALKTIGDAADELVDLSGDIAEKVVDVAGDVTEGVTRAVAGDKVADKVKSTFDNVEHAVERTVHGIASVIATPFAALDDMAQNGFIDGLTKHVVDGSQDVMGATARLLGGEKAEKKFDKAFDGKVQSYIELGLSTAIRAGLIFVPGGQAVLLGDAVSEVGSLGYRAANDEKLGTMDYLGAGLAFLGVGGAGAVGAGAKGAVSAGAKGSVSASTRATGTTATVTAAKYSDDVAKVAIAGSTDDVVKLATTASTKSASSTTKNITKNSADDVGGTVVKSGDNVTNTATTTSEKVTVIAQEVAMAYALNEAITAGMRHYNGDKQAQPQKPDTPLQPIQTDNTFNNYNNLDNSESFNQPLMYQNERTFIPTIPTTNWGF